MGRLFAIWHLVPLYGDPATDPFSMAEFEPRARRTRLFCDAYGLGDRGELVDKIVERQRAGRRAIMQAADAGDPAYQRLRDMGAGTGVQRQIGYVLAHRSTLQDALT